MEAVADTSRRYVLDLVLAHGEVTPTALGAELPFTRQAVAKHLTVLDRFSLVEIRRNGGSCATRSGRSTSTSLFPTMAKVAAGWDARLEAAA